MKVDLNGFVDGQEAGLAHFAKSNCRLAIVQTAGVRTLLRRELSQDAGVPVKDASHVWLRSAWGVAGLAHFSYSFDGSTFTDTSNPCRLTWGSYRGDRIGLYSINTTREQGYADFSDFHYQIK